MGFQRSNVQSTHRSAQSKAQVNIALSAVLIALLLIRGALFRIAYNRGTFKSSSVGFNPLGEDLAAIIFSNIAIYPLALSLQWQWIKSAPPYHILVPLLTGNYGKDSIDLATIKNYLYSPPINDLVAFVAICIVSWLLGFGAHWLVRRFNLDRKIPLLRFTSNEWYYTLYPVTEPFNGVEPKILAIIALDLKSETYLYLCT